MSDLNVKQESGLVLFSNPEFAGSLRGKEEPDGTIWVVAKDVAVALGYTSTNMTQVFSHVPDTWKGSKPIATLGGEQEMLVLYEQGLYFFLARSDKPKALPFQMWLSNDVMPSIRKTGSYSMVPQGRAIDRSYVEALDYFYRNTCKVEGVQVAFAVDRAWKRIDGNSPLELGGIQLQAQSDDDDPLNYVTVTKIAEMFGLSSAQALNPILTGLGLQEAKQKYKRVKLEDGTYERDENGEIKQVPAGFDYTPTELGKQHGGKRLPKKAGDAPEKWNLYWHKDKLPAYLREVYFKATNSDEEE